MAVLRCQPRKWDLANPHSSEGQDISLSVFSGQGWYQGDTHSLEAELISRYCWQKAKEDFPRTRDKGRELNWVPGWKQTEHHRCDLAFSHWSLFLTRPQHWPFVPALSSWAFIVLVRILLSQFRENLHPSISEWIRSLISLPLILDYPSLPSARILLSQFSRNSPSSDLQGFLFGSFWAEVLQS